MPPDSRLDPLLSILGGFRIEGGFLGARRYGGGHINDTFVSAWTIDGAVVRYLHQRINEAVFSRPDQVMDNIRRVTSHLRDRASPGINARNAGCPGRDESGRGQAGPSEHAGIAGDAGQAGPSEHAGLAGDAGLVGHAGHAGHSRHAGVSRRTLTIVEARNGESWVRDADGGWWRTYLFIEGTRSFDKAEMPFQAREAGAAVGRFQKDLVDLPPPRLFETIPAFHDMETRYRAFDAALSRDRENRAAGVDREIRFMLDNRERGSVLIRALREGRIPERICHNDAKIGNILFDAESESGAAAGTGATPDSAPASDTISCPDAGATGARGGALCLVDLDTVMPGTPLFDLGDLIRTVPALTEEDDPDLPAAGIDLPRYQALLEGYLSEASSFLTGAERNLLAESGRNLTQIMGLRFLTDYLDGDRYYRTTRSGQNLDRSRNQIALIEAMDASWAELEAIVSRIADC